MTLKIKYVLLLFFLAKLSFGQEKKFSVSDFDTAYLQEMKSENAALSSRIKTFPANVQELNKQIGQALRGKNDSKVLELAIEADKIYPNNADIKHFKGKMQAKLSEYDAALKSFDEAITLNPKNKWFYVDKATVLADNGQTQEALKTVEKLNSLYPDWSIGHNIKAALLHTLNKNDEALKSYNLAVNAMPKSAQILTNRADLYLVLNKESEAISDYKAALKIQPDYSRAQEKLDTISKTTISQK